MIPRIDDGSSNMFSCVPVSFVSMRSGSAMVKLGRVVGAYVSVLSPLFKPHMSARPSNARQAAIVPILVAFRMFCARSVSVLIAMSGHAHFFPYFFEECKPRHIDVSAATCTETWI